MGRIGPLFSTPEKQRQYQMIRFDRLPRAMRDKVNYADKQYYIGADGMLLTRADRTRTGCNRR
jgi:hypothetical protein